jgi:hypothetical protein
MFSTNARLCCCRNTQVSGKHQRQDGQRQAQQSARVSSRDAPQQPHPNIQPSVWQEGNATRCQDHTKVNARERFHSKVMGGWQVEAQFFVFVVTFIGRWRCWWVLYLAWCGVASLGPYASCCSHGGWVKLLWHYISLRFGMHV